MCCCGRKPPFALPATAGAAATAAEAQAQLSPLVQVRVICARERKGRNVITYSCPNMNTCVNVSGRWKCRPPQVVGQCNVCYSNYNRDSKNCGPGSGLREQKTGELKRCLQHCN